ncbi:MAG: glycosyltransferase family 2 protein [Deltaproteobacteria bacterium]|nr:glycosyltransferase family 2 protein [Deltaproteobacteria bacterium]
MTLQAGDLTVAMITMNEEGAVARVIDDIRAVAPAAEILIVDSSKDRTPEIAEEKGARVIRQFPPKGYGPAMDLALRSAAGRVVITMDCDGTYPAERIPELAKLVLQDGYDVVDASRLGMKPDAMPWANYLGNLLFALLASVLFGKHITDLHSGMRAYRKSMIDSLRYEPRGAALPVELLLRPLRDGFRLKVVFIDYKDRIGQSTMRPLQTSWWTVKRILRVRLGLG